MKTINFTDVTCGVLTKPLCMEKAKSLLYESYISHLAWEITHDNPSNIKINHIDGLTTLTDDYDDISTWFSISHGDDVIACARLCYEDEQGLLEVERYENAKGLLQPILAQKKALNIVELNREAMLPFYGETTTYFGLLLLKTIFSHCLINKQSILTTSNITDWVVIYEMIGFSALEEYTFKYFDSEPHPVLVYFATESHLQQLLKNIDHCLYVMEKTSGNVTPIMHSDITHSPTLTINGK